MLKQLEFLLLQTHRKVCLTSWLTIFFLLIFWLFISFCCGIIAVYSNQTLFSNSLAHLPKHFDFLLKENLLYHAHGGVVTSTAATQRVGPPELF